MGIKKSVITDFSSGTPSSTHSVATGYSVGAEWVNTDNGDRFYHKTDGNWVILGADSPFYIQGGTSSAFDTISSIYRTGSLNIGTGTASNSRFVVSSSGGTTSLVVTEDGRVGIGTASPSTTSRVSIDLGTFSSTKDGIAIDGNCGNNPGSTGVRFSLLNTTENASGFIRMVRSVGTTYLGMQITSQSRDGISFNTDTVTPTEKMRITSDGNIGIGTASPSTKLHVYGTQSGVFRLEDGTQGVGKFLTSDSNGVASWVGISLGTYSSGSVLFSNGTIIAQDNSNFFWDDTNNRLGIGTPQPSRILDVRGDVIINELIIGRGVANIASNTVLGKDALLSNINGANVTAIGVSALRANQTGGFNTAVGFNSLLTNTTGPNNTAIGADSLKFNQTGINNTATGVSALLTNVSGINNTAIGHDSLRLSTGNNNSALGKDSLRTNVGSNNTAVGLSSLHSNTSGSNNTAIGFSSLYANISGSNTTAIGWEAGRFLPNKATAATALTESIMIGYRSSPLDNSQVNQVVIGINANGLGSNTTVLGNSSTITTAIFGNLLLGTTSPTSSARLRIDSTTQGVLLPRMTTDQVNAIVSPVQGLTVFNTDLNTLCFYTTSWQKVTTTTM